MEKITKAGKLKKSNFTFFKKKSNEDGSISLPGNRHKIRYLGREEDRDL